MLLLALKFNFLLCSMTHSQNLCVTIPFFNKVNCTCIGINYKKYMTFALVMMWPSKHKWNCSTIVFVNTFNLEIAKQFNWALNACIDDKIFYIRKHKAIHSLFSQYCKNKAKNEKTKQFMMILPMKFVHAFCSSCNKVHFP